MISCVVLCRFVVADCEIDECVSCEMHRQHWVEMHKGSACRTFDSRSAHHWLNRQTLLMERLGIEPEHDCAILHKPVTALSGKGT